MVEVETIVIEEVKVIHKQHGKKYISVPGRRFEIQSCDGLATGIRPYPPPISDESFAPVPRWYYQTDWREYRPNAAGNPNPDAASWDRPRKAKALTITTMPNTLNSNA